MRILVVDDEQPVWRMLAAMFPEHSVDWAPDATSALTKVAAGYDMAIVDGRLRGISGPTLAARLRERLPLLGFTGDHVCAQQFADLGIPCVLKPAGYAELEAGIARAVGVTT